MKQNDIEDLAIEISIALDALNRVYNVLNSQNNKDRKFISVVRSTNRLKGVYDELRALCEGEEILKYEYDKLKL